MVGAFALAVAIAALLGLGVPMAPGRRGGRRSRPASVAAAGARPRAHRPDREARAARESGARVPTSAAPGSRTCASALKRRRSRAAASPKRRVCLGGPKARSPAGLVTVGRGWQAAGGRDLGAGQADAAEAGEAGALDRRRAGVLTLPGVLRRLRLAGPRLERRLRSPPRMHRELPGEHGGRAFRLRPVRAVGCTGGNAELVTNAPTPNARSSPSPSTTGRANTPTATSTCCGKRACPGTFFEIGQEMPGREATMRRILAEGDEIGDHTEEPRRIPGVRADRRRGGPDRENTPASSPASSARRAAP